MATSSLPKSSVPTKAAKGTCTTGWHDSLLSLLQKGARSGQDESGLDMIIVDNAKPHRRSQSAAATVTPTSSLDDSSLGDFRAFLDGLLDEEIEKASPTAKSLSKFHNSYPAQRRPRKSTGLCNSRQNILEWGSSSDPEIGHLTLDDMLREEECGPSSRICIPRRPVRQISLDGPIWDDDLKDDSEHSQQGNPSKDI